MKMLRMAVALAAVAGLTGRAVAAERDSPSWDKLKSLVGGWQGSYEGKPSTLRSPGEHVMKRLVLTFPAPDHLVQEWTSREGAQEHVGRFEFTRKK